MTDLNKADTDTFHRSDQVDASRVGEQIVLYNRTSRSSPVLNASGANLWESLVEPRTTDGLAEQLIQEFPELDATQAVDDVGSYLTQLLEQGVVFADS